MEYDTIIKALKIVMHGLERARHLNDRMTNYRRVDENDAQTLDRILAELNKLREIDRTRFLRLREEPKYRRDDEKGRRGFADARDMEAED
jgi:hypothetical protein